MSSILPVNVSNKGTFCYNWVCSVASYCQHPKIPLNEQSIRKKHITILNQFNTVCFRAYKNKSRLLTSLILFDTVYSRTRHDPEPV